MEDGLVTLREAAEVAGRTVQTLKRWIKLGYLVDQRVAGDRRSPIVIRRDELEAFLDKPPAEVRVRSGLGVPDALVEMVRDVYLVAIEELRADKRRLLEENQRLRKQLERVGG